jgi:hypothetical protein
LAIHRRRTDKEGGGIGWQKSEDRSQESGVRRQRVGGIEG